MTTAKAIATNNNQSYGAAGNPVTQALLTTNEPSLKWVNGAATLQGQVSWDVSNDGNGVVVAALSKNNKTCWYIVDNLSAVVPTNTPSTTADLAYGFGGTPAAAGSATAVPDGAGTFYASAPNAATCNATAAVAGVTPVPWKTNGF